MGGSPATRHGLPPLRRTAQLPDDELADFIGAGCQRMFLRFCLRKLPPAVVAIDGLTVDRCVADQMALTIFMQIWETAPLWNRRTGEAHRQLSLLMAKAGVPSLGVGSGMDAKRLTALLRALEQDVRVRPQRRPWLVRMVARFRGVTKQPFRRHQSG